MNKNLILRGILISILVVLPYIVLHDFYALIITWIIAFLSTALLIKTDEIKNAIWIGIRIGTLTGILYFSYLIYNYMGMGIGITDLGFPGIMVFVLTMVWISFCILGILASYFIRGKNEEEKNEISIITKRVKWCLLVGTIASLIFSFLRKRCSRPHQTLSDPI